jgi:ATP-dependent RNA helicase DHX29
MVAKLHAKLNRIEKDVLFDKFVAEQQWKLKKATLEKELAATRKKEAEEARLKKEAGNTPSGEVNEEAERITAEILAGVHEDDDDAITGLFASLPVTEVDAVTGKTNTVLNGSDGRKVTIRDFGKWTGVNPTRVLEEACRSRLAFWVLV